MKKGIIWLLIFVFLISVTVSAGGKKEKEEPSVETPEATVAAVVNGSEITSETVEIDLERFKEQLIRTGRIVSDDDNEELKGVVLDGLINRELLRQASMSKGFEATEDQVESRLQEIKGQFADETQFASALAAENLTLDDLLDDLRTGLSIQQLLENEVFPAVSVHEEDILEFYNANPDQFMQPESVQASHILIMLDPEAGAESREEAFAKIKAVQAKLGEGADFADLAREFSEGPSNVKGGDLGFFGRGQMVRPFEEAAFSLDIDQVSDVVETQFGLHLIKVYDKRVENIMALDTVAGDIEEYLLQLRTNEAVDKYTGILRADADIEIF